MATTIRPYYNKKQQELLTAYDYRQTDWFIHNHQTYDQSNGALDTIPLGQLLEAINRTEKEFEQFPLNTTSVKNIAVSLFVNGEQLREVPEFYVVDEKKVDGDEWSALYIGGGRHRIQAIVDHLEFSLSESTELDAILNSTEVLVFVRTVPDLQTLAERIQSNNQSRVLRGAEAAAMVAQAKYGVSAHGAKVGDLTDLINSEAPKAEKRNVIANELRKLAVSKKQPLQLQTQTWFTIGQKFATLLLATEEVPQKGNSYHQVFKHFLSVLPDLVEKRNVTNIARAVDQLVTDYAVDYLEPSIQSGEVPGGASKKTTKKSKADELVEA